MREIHKKTVTEADLILKQMQTARDQRVGAEEERVQDDVQNEERTEVQREERGGEGIQDEGTMEQILDKLGFQRLKEIFQKEEVTKEVFMASSALKLKTILDIPFGKIKELKIALEKNNEPGFLCPFCEITFVSAEHRTMADIWGRSQACRKTECLRKMCQLKKYLNWKRTLKMNSVWPALKNQVKMGVMRVWK